MQEELNQFIANDVWELVPKPRNMKIIETKWVFRNKLDENGVVSRNKARLVAQGYIQQEGIDYVETYAPVARLESIRILLAYAFALEFKLFQMDVKSAFLNSFINEETQSDHGKKRPRESNTSSSSSTTTQNHPSLSLPLDANSDENDDELFHSHSSSSSQNISSSSNVVLRVRQNLPHESHDLNTYLSETINIHTQQRDAHQDGLRSTGQAIKDTMSGKRH
nr:copia protein [Tanacetum cinerariifolium]